MLPETHASSTVWLLRRQLWQASKPSYKQKFPQALGRNDVYLKSGHGDISKCASNRVNSGLKPHESVTHELRVIHLTVKYGQRVIASMPYSALQLAHFY